MSGPFWKVAVDAPLPAALTYKVPDHLQNPPLVRGQSVVVPLGRRQCLGVLLDPTDDVPANVQIKEIASVSDERPILQESFLKWLEWLAYYYLHPPGQVFELAFPPLSKSTKQRKSKRAPVAPVLDYVAPPTITEEQQTCLSAIQSHQGFQTHLLHGVTGSGKTEVYIRLLEDLVGQGKQGVVLVPEISLTPQLIQRFARRLGDAVAVIHSHLTAREKTNQWWAMVEGQKQVLIGARSALFCPMPRLGAIIVDEEHEASFKQDEKLKYHARDAAVMLGKFLDIPVVLGSATPSLESWRNAQGGRYHLHEMKKRVEDRSLPEIQVVDLREHRDERRSSENKSSELPFWLSQPLYEGLHLNYSQHYQSALFLNRRGMAQTVLCPACGYTPECPNCAVSLTLHGRNHLVCHYCDYHLTLQEKCTDCKEGEPKALGMGTELIETDLQKLFPESRIVRVDRDEITTREDLESVIGEIESGEVDFIVGTQMIAKGLDFPRLTLVGLVMADIGFNMPDFRSGERSFQLLTQVSGRSGRHLNEGAGKVIIQTYNPDHPSIQFTCAHDYEGFARYEAEFREALHYPPVWRLASCRIQSQNQDRSQTAASSLASRARALQQKGKGFELVEILGPAQAPLAKLRGQHRFHLLVKAPDAGTLVRFCRHLVDDLKWVPPQVRIMVDMDAINLL